MPRIGVRVGQAGGGDFSGLYGSQGRGIASGIQAGMGMAQQMQEMALQRQMLEERRQFQEHIGSEFQKLGKSPDEVERLQAMDPNVGMAILEREQQVAQAEQQAKSLRSTRRFLASHPRGQRYAQEIDALEQGGAPYATILDKTFEYDSDLRETIKYEEKAGELLQKAAALSEIEAFGADTRVALRMAAHDIEMAIQNQQDPNWGDTINAKDLEDWDTEMREAFITSDDKQRYIDMGMAIAEQAAAVALMSGMGAKRTGEKSWAFPRPDDAMQSETAQALQAGPPQQQGEVQPPDMSQNGQAKRGKGDTGKPERTAARRKAASSSYAESTGEITREQLGVKEGQTVTLNSLGREKDMGPGGVSREDVVSYLSRVYESDGSQAVLAKMKELGISPQSGDAKEIRTKAQANRNRGFLGGAVGGR